LFGSHLVSIFTSYIFGARNKESGSSASRIYVPTDFDTKEKALSVAKAAEKGLK